MLDSYCCYQCTWILHGNNSHWTKSGIIFTWNPIPKLVLHGPVSINCAVQAYEKTNNKSINHLSKQIFKEKKRQARDIKKPEIGSINLLLKINICTNSIFKIVILVQENHFCRAHSSSISTCSFYLQVVQ